jgi:hypothetical protein
MIEKLLVGWILWCLEFSQTPSREVLGLMANDHNLAVGFLEQDNP